MAVEIPGYKILRTLGRGGMATVYLAIQEVFEREVALKVMSRTLAEDPNFTQRFFREAKIVSKLVHPNIVTVHDVGVHDGYCYLSMEYIDGRDLRYVFGSLTLREKIQAIRDIAKALDYSGVKGYVHRDIKPENIMFHLSDGRAVLMDFGIARAAESETMVTQVGTAIGTPHYMSPEQAKGKSVDGRSDIYSLGVVFFYIFAGRVPYDAESAVAVGIKHITEPVPLLPPAYEALQPLVDKMMAKDVEKRYQSAKQLIADLDMLDLEVLEHSLEFSTHTLMSRSDTLAERETSVYESRPAEYTASSDPYLDELSTFDNYVADTDELSKDKAPILSWMIAGSFVISVIALFLYFKNPALIQPYLDRAVSVFTAPERPGSVEIEPSVPREPGQGQVIAPTAAETTAKTMAQGHINRTAAAPALAPAAGESVAVEKEKLEAEQRLAIAAAQEKIEQLKHAYQRDEIYLVELVAAFRNLLQLGNNAATLRMDFDRFRQQELASLKDFAAKGGSSAALTKKVDQYRLLFPEEKKAVFDDILAIGNQRKKVMSLIIEAEAYLKQNNLTKPVNRNALDTYNKALALDPNNEQALLGKRQIAQRLADVALNKQQSQQYDMALRSAQKALEIDPLNSTALQVEAAAGTVFERRDTITKLLLSADRKITQGDLFSPANEGAFHDYQKVLDLDPGNATAQVGLERVVDALSAKVWQLVGSEQFSQAKELMHAPLKEFGANPRVQSLGLAVEEVIGDKINTTEPRIDSMRIRARPFDPLLSESSGASSSRYIFLDFRYAAFQEKTNVVQAVLLNGDTHVQIAQVPVIIVGASGKSSFRIERPVEGFSRGSYAVEIRHGTEILNSTLFKVE